MNLAMNLTGMSMWCLIAYWMYCHNEGVGFTNKDLAHVTNLQKVFKAQKTLLHLRLLMAQHHEELTTVIGTLAMAAST
ncbi:uncharacterized protein ACA1_143560 [Acanthamoeba castellanii str. Neff]|uniref:Uncharacterized protein n=1 Tax=Acanthamoeba castellanii (strain ATCC 30010 / Neff) TaxID=1257118 RepID=L8HHR3_ACACF|nr:uncharacterized protein ACA1_143560 [Acanthamoeba castellanii str. Neff]ELR23976.1 hypothetical protein ACA1_143560 [Acanthamoeba castellanii str. Neff]